jgi:hypothetical protein
MANPAPNRSRTTNETVRFMSGRPDAAKGSGPAEPRGARQLRGTPEKFRRQNEWRGPNGRLATRATPGIHRAVARSRPASGDFGRETGAASRAV